MLPVGLLSFCGAFMVALNLLWTSLTTCMCGHTGLITTAVALPSFAIMLLAGYHGRRNGVVERAFFVLLLAAQALLLGKNLIDLVSGHP